MWTTRRKPLEVELSEDLNPRGNGVLSKYWSQGWVRSAAYITFGGLISVWTLASWVNKKPVTNFADLEQAIGTVFKNVQMVDENRARALSSAGVVTVYGVDEHLNVNGKEVPDRITLDKSGKPTTSYRKVYTEGNPMGMLGVPSDSLLAGYGLARILGSSASAIDSSITALEHGKAPQPLEIQVNGNTAFVTVVKEDGTYTVIFRNAAEYAREKEQLAGTTATLSQTTQTLQHTTQQFQQVKTGIEEKANELYGELGAFGIPKGVFPYARADANNAGLTIEFLPYDYSSNPKTMIANLQQATTNARILQGILISYSNVKMNPSEVKGMLNQIWGRPGTKIKITNYPDTADQTEGYGSEVDGNGKRYNTYGRIANPQKAVNGMGPLQK